MSWTANTRYLIDARLSSTASTISETTTLYSSSSAQQQLVSITATSATGPSVDTVTTPKLSRKLWP